MKIGTVLRTINKNGAVYLCMGGSLAMSWSSHCIAVEKTKAYKRQLTFTNDAALRSIASVIDWIAANRWLAIAYIFLVVASVAFLQIRRRPPWTHWLAALCLCAPCLFYWSACAYYATALLAQ
jgi:hypothetical protein